MTAGAGETLRMLERVIFLKKSPLFSTMRTSDLRAIAEIAEELTFEKGGEIVRENDVGDSMYIIREGSVKITKLAGERQVELAQLGAGDFFGDMAMFDAEVRSASAVAGEACTLLRIDSGSLKDVLLDYPAIAVEFLKIFVKRLRKANAAIQALSARVKERGAES